MMDTHQSPNPRHAWITTILLLASAACYPGAQVIEEPETGDSSTDEETDTEAPPDMGDGDGDLGCVDLGSNTACIELGEGNIAIFDECPEGWQCIDSDVDGCLPWHDTDLCIDTSTDLSSGAEAGWYTFDCPPGWGTACGTGSGSGEGLDCQGWDEKCVDDACWVRGPGWPYQAEALAGDALADLEHAIASGAAPSDAYPGDECWVIEGEVMCLIDLGCASLITHEFGDLEWPPLCGEPDGTPSIVPWAFDVGTPEHCHGVFTGHGRLSVHVMWDGA